MYCIRHCCVYCKLVVDLEALLDSCLGFFVFAFCLFFCNYFVSVDVFHHRRDMVTACLSLCDMSRPLMLSTWEPGLLG